MLCPKIHRQRVAIEFITEKNLYSTEFVEELFENFLHDLCASLELTIIVEPIIKTVEDGTSAYVMFKESGCSIHSWFEYKFCSIDLYSCKPFSVSDVLNVIDYWFEPQTVEVI